MPLNDAGLSIVGGQPALRQISQILTAAPSASEMERVS
jgi:hypothetical protein